MQYSCEETALLISFMGPYFTRSSVSFSVQNQYGQIVQRLQTNSLVKADLLWIERAILFLRPFWWPEHEDHRALTNALLRTQALARESK